MRMLCSKETEEKGKEKEINLRGRFSLWRTVPDTKELSMGPVEAFKLALSKEIEAMEMYKKFSLEFPVAEETFLFLAREEQKHKLLIEKQIADMTAF